MSDDERSLNYCSACAVASRAYQCYLCGGPTVPRRVKIESETVEAERRDDE